MELVQLVTKCSQGVCQRVFIELVRRKIEVDNALIGKQGEHMTMVLGISNLPGKEKILYALKSIPDVISAEFLEEGVSCRWETIPKDGSSFEILRGSKDAQRVTF